jgi:hypothetical protein
MSRDKLVTQDKSLERFVLGKSRYESKIMKRLLAFLALVFTVITVQADLVIQEKVESADQHGVVTTKIKGDRTRIDMPTDRLGDVSVIDDVKTGDKIMMIHGRKQAKMESGAEVAQKEKSDGTETASSKPVNSGRTEKVGGYDTEIYTWTNNSDMGSTLWVAKCYPDYAKIRLDLKTLYQTHKNTSADTSTLPGMVVKSKTESAMGERTMTLISAKEEPVKATDFRIPADYQVQGLQISTGQAGH